MTPEQKKMLEEFGVYPTIQVSGGGSDGYYGGGGRLGMVAELMKNLKFNSGVSGYGNKSPSSEIKLVPTNYDASLNYETDKYGDFGIEGEIDPNSKDYSVFAKWKKKF